MRRQLFFPDRRLLQYDCGKLVELDALLRRLKAGSHRVLIFTQVGIPTPCVCTTALFASYYCLCLLLPWRFCCFWVMLPHKHITVVVDHKH